MRIRHLAGVFVLALTGPCLTSCGGSDTSSEADGPGGDSAQRSDTSPGDADEDSTPETPKLGAVKACDVITKAEATAFLGTTVDHPGSTPAEKKQSGSATYCVWARPGTPFVFDDAPATAVTVTRNAKLVKQLAGAGVGETDVAGYVAYRVPDKDDNTGYVYVVLDKETIVQVGSVRKAGNAAANADLAIDLAEAGFARLG